MGQYHILVNLTKKQFVHPHQVGNGLKLWEQVGFEHSLSTALYMLIAASNGRGGGDFAEHHLIGSWAGDSIALIGDYAEPNDVPSCLDSRLLYSICGYVAHQKDIDYLENEIPEEIKGDKRQRELARLKSMAELWTNISDQVRDMMITNFPDIRYTGEGWLNIEKIKPEEKGKKFAQFYYPPSNKWYEPTPRKVEIIEEDAIYIKGLDTGDKNRFKQFRKDRIVGQILRYH